VSSAKRCVEATTIQIASLSVRRVIHPEIHALDVFNSRWHDACLCTGIAARCSDCVQPVSGPDLA